jgi:hypothetical protein
MKNLINLNRFLTVIFLFLIWTSGTGIFGAAPGKQEYYQIRIYRITQKSQEDRVDAYLKDAYLPALHKAGIAKIGVFKPVEADSSFGKLIYVFIPFKSIEQYGQLSDLLLKDKVYTEAAKSFLDAPYNDPPYLRYENILCRAFAGMPQFRDPMYTNPKSERIYEYRSYESATDAKAEKKREMFNTGGEIALFEKIGSNAIFYAEVVSGSLMPRLIYMTSYSDMKSHDDHWKAFVDSEGWKKLSTMEEYKNTVSKVSPFLLHPASYSDF